MVRLHSISMIRDEADIIEDFVRHHGGIVEKMHITLNQSADGTRGILERLQREGLPLSLSEESSSHYPQAEVLTGLMRQAALEGADLIAVLDGDEFLRSKTGTLAEALAATDLTQPTLLPWRTFVPTPEDDAAESSIPRRIRHYRSEERPQYCKLLIPASIARDPNATIPMGAHHLLNTKTGEPYPATISSSLYLAHFPVRSEAQLRHKVLTGWTAYARHPARKAGENYHWEQLFLRCQDPSPILPEELREIALRYAMRDFDATPSPILL